VEELAEVRGAGEAEAYRNLRRWLVAVREESFGLEQHPAVDVLLGSDSLVAPSKADDRDAGLAASFPNVGLQVGGAIGLAAAVKAGHPLHLSAAQAKAAEVGIYDHALAAGFSRGFVVSAGIMALALIVAIVMIRVTREDLAGVQPIPG
jgi:hypothetical protein